MRIKVILQNYNTTHTKYQELLSVIRDFAFNFFIYAFL